MTSDLSRITRTEGGRPMDTHIQTMPVAHHSHRLPTAAALGALGVVYGDIGTSPLYAVSYTHLTLPTNREV